MFSLSYIWAELRRRRGRTVLTALGLGVGVALVVVVSALSAGLDDAQDEVLEPLTGVGTDLSVTRPIDLQDASASEREQLQEENGGARFGLRNRGEPGEQFEDDRFTSTQLSFDAGEAKQVAALDGAATAAAGLTVTALHVSGQVPEQPENPGQFGGDGQPPGDGPANIDVQSRTVTGVDTGNEGLGAIAPSQVADGRWFSARPRREAILNAAYARREGIAVGDRVDLAGKSFKVVGLAETPLGGQASDIYTDLAVLQGISDRKGRANVIYARAEDSAAVAGLERAIEGSIEGAEVTTASDLADRVGGSLVDAKNLSSKLGAALTIVALTAAVLIAILLTLSSVAKRVRELGTLKALGWPQRRVVGQVTGESLAQGALGGLIGAVLGIAGAAVITAIGPELQASVAEAAAPAVRGGPGGGGIAAAFGQGQVASGSTSVVLEAPVDFGLIVLAISLALLGGLLAGAAGGLRTARLRPADALRHLD
jgi:putative ABC transport system permease protein